MWSLRVYRNLIVIESYLSLCIYLKKEWKDNDTSFSSIKYLGGKYHTLDKHYTELFQFFWPYSTMGLLVPLFENLVRFQEFQH